MVAPASWAISGNRTAFNFSLLSIMGKDLSQGVVICEFYFKPVDGKTTGDFDGSTFHFEKDYSEGSFLKGFFNQQGQASGLSLGTNSSEFYYYNYADGTDSVELGSFTYTNSDVISVGSLEIADITGITVPVLYKLNNSTAKTVSTTATPVLTVKDTSGGTIASNESAYPDITWSITGTNPDSSKITINASTGVLSVAPGAKAGTVTIQASGAGKTATKDVVVSRSAADATLLTVSGDATITVPTTGNIQKIIKAD